MLACVKRARAITIRMEYVGNDHVVAFLATAHKSSRVSNVKTQIRLHRGIEVGGMKRREHFNHFRHQFHAVRF